MSREGELNSRLIACEQIYRRLGVDADLAGLDLSKIPEDRRRFFVTAFYDLLRAIDAVAHFLKEVNLDEVIQNVAPRSLQIYRDKLAPHRKRLERLLMELLGLPNVELDLKEFRPDLKDSPVWNIFVSGLNFWEMDESGAFSEDDLKATDRLIYSSFFQPDEWLRNADEIEPILGKAAEQRIPSNIRIRLKELYRSFILGNHLSTIALARAVLEYSLIDRAAKIGINPLSDDPRYPNRSRKLGMLVEDASENRPELKLDMESIVDAGNKTLHPRKKDKLVLLPSALRSLALASIKSVRRVVENLYLEP